MTSKLTFVKKIAQFSNRFVKIIVLRKNNYPTRIENVKFKIEKGVLFLRPLYNFTFSILN